MSNHYGFFHNGCNDIMHSSQGVYLTSSSSPATVKDIKGFGTYMYGYNLRRSVALFGVRSLVKSNWQNSNDVYIGWHINE